VLRPNAGHDLILEVSRSHIATHNIGRTSPDEWAARRRDLYLSTHNPVTRKTSMSPAGSKLAISANERSQTYVLDRAATEVQETALCNINGKYYRWEYVNKIVNRIMTIFLFLRRYNGLNSEKVLFNISVTLVWPSFVFLLIMNHEVLYIVNRICMI